MQNEISQEITIASLLSRWPEMIPIFLQHRMTCVGCTMAPYERLSDAMAIYGLDPETFMAELRQAMRGEPE
ncbi:MAG TPA: DUF1858 domain-containing protein [Anaerolineaceae bacterium]|nr:DUF1858 domain-containing protein [Anaerolineaceae bacterium]